MHPITFSFHIILELASSLFTHWFNILKPLSEAKFSIKMILLDSQVTYEPVWWADAG
jgi:hypothetical protein